MTNLKKLVSFLLVVAVMSTFMITVMAAGTPTITFSSAEADPGDTVNVTMTLTNNIGYQTLQIITSYDSNLSLTKAKWPSKSNTIHPNMSSNTGSNPMYIALGDLMMDLSMYADEDELAENGYNSNGIADDGLIVTFVFKVADNATPGSKLNITGVMNDDANNVTYTGEKIGSLFNIVPGVITVKGTPAPTTYTVTYDAGEGSNAPAADTNVAADTVIDLTQKAQPQAPSGKQFKGWSANGKDIITSLTVTGDVTLTALYEEIPATSLLEGIYTRLAKNVTIDYTNKTINLVYDTAQRVFQSSYVAFAPKAADGVTVTYSSKDAFISDHARLTNYTETASSATNIDLAAEKATSKSAIVGNAIQNAQGTFNFTMHLENVSGEVTEDYQVTVQLTDTSAEVVGLVANSGITAADFKTFRESDEVAIDTPNKVITLTTKNMYNYTTIAIDATKIGKNAIATNAARPHRAMQLVNADDNARYIDFANVELANQYSSAVLVNYVNGETRSYPVRIYGGSDGTSYEDYTLTVVYAPTTNTNDIKIGRIHNLANAIGNSVAEINETGKIQITYDPAKSEISFSPVYARGYYPTISGDEGKVVTEQQIIAGALRDIYTIKTDNIPSALKYNVRRIRDTRVYDFGFLTK